MKSIKNNKLSAWIPSIIFAAVGLVMFVVNSFLHGVTVLLVLQFFSCMAVPFLVPILGLIVKREFSPSLSFNLGLLILVGVYIERVFNVYSFFPSYDKILHTNFGFIGTAIVYSLMLRWNGDKINHAGVIFLLMLSVLGLGGAWELFEYSSAMFTLEDPQVWKETVNASIAAGEIVGNPLTDTMQDMLVTVIGSAAFCILYMVDVFAGAGFFKKFFGNPDSIRPQKANVALGVEKD